MVDLKIPVIFPGRNASTLGRIVPRESNFNDLSVDRFVELLNNLIETGLEGIAYYPSIEYARERLEANYYSLALPDQIKVTFGTPAYDKTDSTLNITVDDTLGKRLQSYIDEKKLIATFAGICENKDDNGTTYVYIRSLIYIMLIQLTKEETE